MLLLLYFPSTRVDSVAKEQGRGSTGDGAEGLGKEPLSGEQHSRAGGQRCA